MKVLLIGNGGREHALAWKIASSPRVKALFALPGNPGTAQFAENVPGIGIMDFAKIERFARLNAIDLIVVGPEDPLAAGIVDHLQKAGFKVFGPNKDAAQLEADKWFAKEIMRQQAIPTAEARVFVDANAADEYINTRQIGVVIKASGLAKGKGVAVCHRPADALVAIDRIMRSREFGSAGERVVIEELLNGPECSVLAFVDGRNIYLMETCQDHKPVNDGDTGPMTGGMGAYSPTPVVTETILRQIERDVFVPILDGLKREQVDYRGVLYAGLMITANGPKVLEFNCRFGDPETQPLMMRLKSDLVDVMLATIDGKLDEIELNWDPRPAISVVATAGGYPGKYLGGEIITGIDDADAMRDVKVFQAGTRRAPAGTAQGNGPIVTDGGRVLAVTAIADTLVAARDRAYEAIKKIHFDGMHCRTDIGWQGMKEVVSG